MYQIAIAARLVLAAVFGLAAILKARDGARRRAGLVAFGVPSAVAGPAGVLLVGAEGATALALLWAPAARFGAAAALALLVLFCVAIAVNLARGRRPLCNCFGQVHAAPIGAGTLARNVVLGALATALVWSRNDGAPADLVAASWTFVQTPASIAAAALLVLLVVLALQMQLVAQHGRILLRLDAIEFGSPAAHGETFPPAAGLPVGSIAPAFALDTLDGERASLESLAGGGKPVVLVFANPNCGPCEALLPEIAHWQHEYASVLTLALVSEGAAGDARTEPAHGITRVLLQREHEVAQAYQAHGTPSAVIVGADGRIASAVAQGADAIRRLVGQALDAGPSAASPRGLAVGDPVPPIVVAGLDGSDVALADALDGRTLLLFWNPRCGFCEAMLPALRAWEARRGAGAPVMVIVSGGEAAEHAAMDVRSRVVLDPRFEAVSAFGATGTPMALIVDEHGAVASDLAAGRDAIVRLLDAEEARPVAARLG